MYVHVLHSSLIHDFSGILRRLLNSSISPNDSGPYVTYCTISFQLLVCSQLTVCHHSALTWPGFPFLPNNWSTLRSSTPALTGANTQVFLTGLYAFQLTATLSQSGEITPIPKTIAGAQVLDRESPCTVRSRKPTFSF